MGTGHSDANRHSGAELGQTLWVSHHDVRFRSAAAIAKTNILRLIDEWEIEPTVLKRDQAQSLGWVKRLTLTVRRSLPVFPD
jgi:hypothetical protein